MKRTLSRITLGLIAAAWGVYMFWQIAVEPLLTLCAELGAWGVLAWLLYLLLIVSIVFLVVILGNWLIDNAFKEQA